MPKNGNARRSVKELIPERDAAIEACNGTTEWEREMEEMKVVDCQQLERGIIEGATTNVQKILRNAGARSSTINRAKGPLAELVAHTAIELLLGTVKQIRSEGRQINSEIREDEACDGFKRITGAGDREAPMKLSNESLRSKIWLEQACAALLNYRAPGHEITPEERVALVLYAHKGRSPAEAAELFQAST